MKEAILQQGEHPMAVYTAREIRTGQADKNSTPHSKKIKTIKILTNTARIILPETLKNPNNEEQRRLVIANDLLTKRRIGNLANNNLELEKEIEQLREENKILKKKYEDTLKNKKKPEDENLKLLLETVEKV